MNSRGGSASWRRRHREAVANQPVPKVYRCTAVRRRDGRFEVRIRGSGFGATVPIVIRVGRQPAVAMSAVRPGELRAVVDECNVGDEFKLDLGPLGVTKGEISDVGPSPGRLFGPEGLLARLRTIRPDWWRRSEDG
jgi:hypothetical protein